MICIYPDQSESLCLFQFSGKYEDTFEGKVYTYMYSGSFNVYAGMQSNVGSYYKSSLDLFKKDSLGVKLRWFFLFLLCKGYKVVNQTYDMWSFLCLKEIGRGFLTEKLKSVTYVMNLVVFVFLNSLVYIYVLFFFLSMY